MGKSLNKVVVVRGIKLPVKVPFAQRSNLSPKKFGLTLNKKARGRPLIPEPRSSERQTTRQGARSPHRHFLRQLQIRECVFCTEGGKDFRAGADLKYNLQHRSAPPIYKPVKTTLVAGFKWAQHLQQL